MNMKNMMPRVQRTPLVEISSDEGSEQENLGRTRERLSLDLPSSPSKQLLCSFQAQNVQNSSSFYDSFSDDDDADQDQSIYDWLVNTDASPEQTSKHSVDSLLTPSRTGIRNKSVDSKTHKMNFSPPGCDSSPLFGMQSTTQSSSEVKDTNHLRKVKAQLPASQKPEVNKGNWLTKRVVLNNYILLDSLGKGSSGEVKLCKERHNNKLFAMKIISKTTRTGNHKPSIPERLKYNDDVTREVAIMKKLRNDSVIRLYEVIDDPRSSTIYLVLEYMKRGDLMQIIKKESMNDEQTWDILRQVIRGLSYLHLNNIVHGDMKPSNLLVAGDGTVKLSDFGISRIKYDGELLNEHMGTPAFMAPEIIAGDSYDGKLADLYSVGATAYFIRFGEPAFKAKSRHKLYQQILHDPVQFPSEANAANELLNLIQALMVKAPSIRLTMERLVLYPWLQIRPIGVDLSNHTSISGNDSVCTNNKRVEITSLDVFNSIPSITALTDINSL